MIRVNCFNQISFVFLYGVLLFIPDAVAESGQQFWSGRQIMEEAYRRHEQFPYVYEEQSIVMVDSRGQRDTRQARRFSRVEEDGTVKFLLLFDSPEEVKGVTLLAIRDTNGKTTKSFYLPAFGETFIESTSTGSGANFLGTDFSVEDLTAEVLSDYRYVRQEDTEINQIKYFVIHIYALSDDITAVPPLRQHFIRQDNFYITHTDYFDRQGRVHKRQRHYDLRQLDADMWRADMILMEDINEQHQSLIKINRRVFSRDYVPAEMFKTEWVFENYPALKPDDLPDEDENIDVSEPVLDTDMLQSETVYVEESGQ